MRSLTAGAARRLTDETRAIVAVALAAVAALVVAAPARADDGALTNHAPTAGFSWLPAVPRTGDDVTLTATGSDPDGDPLAYRWDLDDDGTYETPGRVVTTRFARGERTVRLLAADLRGGEARATEVVTVANAAPVGTFSWGPSSPKSGDDVTLGATATDPERDPITYSWDLDGDGRFEKSGQTVHAKFTRGGRSVRMRASDPSGDATITAQTIDVSNAPPTGDVAISSDDAPRSGDPVHFTAIAVADPDDGADALAYAWDLDGDGRFETDGRAADTSYPAPGRHDVALRLTDPQGTSTEIRRSLVVLNRPPVAAFSLSTAAPAPDEDVELTSQATDPDGGTLQLEQAWDLDGDGSFDDASGPVAHGSFAEGEHVVRLRVTDGDGGSSVAERRLVVRAATAPPVVDVVAAPGSDPLPAPAPSAAPSGTAASTLPMMPFPVIRLRGRLTARGVAVQLLTVRAGRGARIEARCTGRGCPRSTRRLVTFTGRAEQRVVALRRLQRRLPAGAVIEIRVSQASRIGKFTRFVVRRGRPPLRVDLCLPPGSSAPRACR
ncbi:MAG TPA: PKD domain-containing protein [Solirubrobacteraceae bacterium]|jgi:hypothetical protein